MTNSNKCDLKPKQRRAAELLANPEFNGTITDLCAQVGVSRNSFYRWMDSPVFLDYLEELIDKYTDSELARVWKALMRKIDQGEIQAIKLYFELKGKYNNGAGVVKTNEIDPFSKAVYESVNMDVL